MKKTNKTTSCLALAASLAVSVSTANATITFLADFEAGTAANTGSITYTDGGATQISSSLGANSLLMDPTSASSGATDITFTPTSTASLAAGNTAVISFDFGIRRTNGTNKSHFVTGYDSNNAIIFQLVLGELDEFGNAGADRQVPGYATSAGGSTALVAADLASGAVPGQFYFASDGNHVDGYNGNGMNVDITVGSDGWSFTADGSFKAAFTTNTLATYDGSTFTELAYVKLTGESTGAGGYLDNISIDGVAIPEPSSTALLGLGGLALVLRRRK